MTIQEMEKGYKEEITYQKRMLKNLGYWFQLNAIISGIGIVLIYFFNHHNLWLNILGIALFIIGALGMLMFGYAGWKGQQNIHAIVNDFDQKINYFRKNYPKKQVH
ncbi:MAG: DUF202 domain-containing protein [Liquorilactobacillus ghanensis]|uniref:PTS fructose transporter subunit IA n=1 Tax=Liquorilactobacillus ghanensis DSM 18630 TaxID=1423750 RepID=A0A0R1VK82_9LACO|nr:hypothetical protein [Liquorilactobacillus ghanensis]KRM05695.1 hypothetical protein FC89_GL001402 [Liquorilactobacillus ghanensis DSM 18630]